MFPFAKKREEWIGGGLALWEIGDQLGTIKDVDYPYEFSVSVPAGETRFTFKTSGIKADGTEFKTEQKAIRVSP